MDRRRAAAALLALAACFACSAAAPTVDHTALDLYDGTTEGCYYNFQHYGEGDRIMTNEPCLNCTCHNRMLMCYLRVCPFTKAIGQDCTVEKRADQCCPIVTCPDVPVDLLTSTSTTSPAEYGGTGLGKVDNYGCSINGKYFPEGSKVPPTPNKPCEHCYCIRNMTTCVMQECTLHVDGCTPIYHKDVCCPVRYHCDHPEDVMPMLDDMSTTVRPTQGFLLTTTTEAPVTVTETQPKRECIENDQLYPDGALIKTEKPCVHCYCMKGDIVCVVQECGTPMENEGKNCTSMPPREGQCCPDTYICEGEEPTTDIITEVPYGELTTLEPPRRIIVEGSGYRNEPDEIPYTGIPTVASEFEGSGEEPGITSKPLEFESSSEFITSEKPTPIEGTDDRFAPTEEGVPFSSIGTIPPLLEETEIETTEPDRGLNTIEEESTEPSILEKTTPKQEPKVTEPDIASEKETESSKITVKETTELIDLERTTPKEEMIVTESTIVGGQDTDTSDIESDESGRRTTPKEDTGITEPTAISGETTSIVDEGSSETSIIKLTTVPGEIHTTEEMIVGVQESSLPDTVERTTLGYEPLTDSKQETVPSITSEGDISETTRTPSRDEVTQTTIVSGGDIGSMEQQTSIPEVSTPRDEIKATETATEIDKITSKYDVHPTGADEKFTATSGAFEESSEPSIPAKTTIGEQIAITESTVPLGEKQTISDEEEFIKTTESPFKKEDESKVPTEVTTEKELKKPTTVTPDLTTKESIIPEYIEPSSTDTIAPSMEYESKLTTAQLPTEQEFVEDSKDLTTETAPHVSDFSKPAQEFTTNIATEGEVVDTTSATDKQELPETTTINPEDNEISEDIVPPGRIPGEGDCLVSGITYRNDSSVPSSNMCYSSCKCVSSIVKCDPILCSPEPEYMDNCQTIYDTPESCCPTYVCDHPRETIPPQSHNQMSGTESPIPSPSIECDGDQCKVSEEPTSLSPGPAQKDEVAECGTEGCAQTPLQTSRPPLELPAECEGDKCIPSTESCSDGKCQPQPTDQQEITPSEEVSPTCESSEDCKQTKIPEIITAPCEGALCTSTTDEGCDKDTGCVVPVVEPCEGDKCEIKPEITPSKTESEQCKNQDDCKIKTPETIPPCEGESCTGITDKVCDKETGCDQPIHEPCKDENCQVEPIKPVDTIAQVCENQEDCKEPSKPDTTILPCEGQSCTELKEDCSTGICKPQPSQEEVPGECVEEECKRKQTSDVDQKPPSECNDSECVQQPIIPSQETTMTVPSSTESPMPHEIGEQEVEMEVTEVTTYVPEPTSNISTTEKPFKSSEIPEPSTPEIEELSTRIPGEMTIKEDLLPEHHTPQTLVTEQKLPESSTEEMSMPTEIPQQQLEEVSPSKETTPEGQEITLVPVIPVTDLYSETEASAEPITVTESPQVTESHEIYTARPYDFVTKEKPQEEVYTELPESHITELEKDTNAPEPEQGITELPKLTVTEPERETVLEISTKSTIAEIEQTLTTESPSSEVEIKQTEPSPIEIVEGGTDKPKSPEVTTEPALHEQDTEIPETPSGELDIGTELPTRRITSPQETNIAETTSSEQEVETATKVSDVTAQDKLETKTPELFVTEEKEITKTTERLPTEEELLEPHVTTPTQDLERPQQETITEQPILSTIGADKTEEPQQETKPELPIQPTIGVDETKTELPIELTSVSEETERPVQETETEIPVLPTLRPEESVEPPQETKTDLPITTTSGPEKIEGPTQETKTEVPILPTPGSEEIEGAQETKTEIPVSPTPDTEEIDEPLQETKTEEPESPISSSEEIEKPSQETKTEVPVSLTIGSGDIEGPSQETKTEVPMPLTTGSEDIVVPSQETKTEVPVSLTTGSGDVEGPSQETKTEVPMPLTTGSEDIVVPSQETKTEVPVSLTTGSGDVEGPSQETKTEVPMPLTTGSEDIVVPSQETKTEVPVSLTTRSEDIEGPQKETQTEIPEPSTPGLEEIEGLSQETKTQIPVSSTFGPKEIEEPSQETKTEVPFSPTSVPEKTEGPTQESQTEVPTLSPFVPEETERPQESKTELPITPTIGSTDIEGPLQETKTELPLPSTSSSEESTYAAPGVSKPDEQKIQTESPMSLVTESQAKDVTTLQTFSLEHDESQTELPVKEPSQTILDEEQIKTEKPESHVEPEKTETDVPILSTEDQAAPTKIPDRFGAEPQEQELPISTESPQTFVTGPETEPEKPQKEPVEEAPVTEQQETKTELPVLPTTGLEEIEGTKVTDAEAPLVTEMPKQPEEEEVRTELPVEIPTEQQESETKAPEPSVPEKTYTEMPDFVTEIEVVTETLEKSTEIPSVPETYTKLSEVSATEDILSSTSISPPAFTTSESSEAITDKVETTEKPEIIPDKKLDTESPEIFTESPESQETVSEKEVTKLSQEISTILPDVSAETKPQITTELPYTKLKDEGYTESGDVETGTKVPSGLETKTSETPMVEDEVTKTPLEQESSTEPQTPAFEHQETVPPESGEPVTVPSKTDEIQQGEKSTELPGSLITESEEVVTKLPELTVTEQKQPESTIAVSEELPEATTQSSVEDITKLQPQPEQTTESKDVFSETTPYLVELQEHPYKDEKEASTERPLEETTTAGFEEHRTEQHITLSTTEKLSSEEIQTELPIRETEKPHDEVSVEEPTRPEIPEGQTTLEESELPEKSSEPTILVEGTTSGPQPSDIQESENRLGTEGPQDQGKETTPIPMQSLENEKLTTPETEKPSIPVEDIEAQIDKETTKPFGAEVPLETSAPEEEFIPTKVTTTKFEEPSTQPPTLFDKFTKPEEKPSEVFPSTTAPETQKPGFSELQPTDEVPSPDEEGPFPPSGGYGQEPDYGEEDQAFGPGTCRYGGKVYVSAQQIPRDDPCDFCFCFRSDIICLQQSCPPPIHGCHEEPIQGFCCPRYECPVSMATTLNVTTTTTTTTTTLPPHFLPHAYKGAAQRRGCQIKGHTYKVGDVVRASSGPCLHCTCGGDGQMKCDPKVCTPEPMLRQMIAVAVSAKRRR